MQRVARIFAVILFGILCIGISSIAEEITLTTYYPAPWGAYEELVINQNCYYEADIWKYQADGKACRYFQNPGQHVFQVATSGLQFEQIDWTDGMMIAENGRVGIGTMTPGAELDVDGTINANALDVSGNVTAGQIDGTSYKVGGEGYAGEMTFETVDGKSVTVINGIVTNIVVIQ